MPNSIIINLDKNSRGYYQPNEIISGTVDVLIDVDELKARCIKIILKGKDYCKIPNGKHSVVGENKFLNIVSMLRGNENSSIQLPKGNHICPFSFQLPPDIPCSVVGTYGYIRYKLEAIVDIPWALDTRFKLEFTVVRIEDMRIFPALGLPVERESIKNCYTCFCKSVQLFKIKARMPKTGYVIGETIPLSVEIINNSRMKINFSTVTIKQIDKYTANNAVVRTVKSKIFESRCSGVDRNDTVSFETFLPLSTDLMITNDRYSLKYKYYYEIRVRAETGIFRCSPSLHIPITIGNIGFNS